MKKNRKIKAILVTCAVVLIVVAGTAGVTNGFKNWGSGGKVEKEESVSGTVMDETNIGIITGDDPWTEMEKLVKIYYGNGQQVSYSGSMRLMDDNDEEQKLLEEHLFDYSFFNDQFYYKMSNIECVGKEKFILLVNHEDKSMAMSSILPARGQEPIMDMKKFREIMERSKAQAKVTQQGADKIITVNDVQDPVVQGYQVFYDPSNYLIRKIIIGMIRYEPLDAESGKSSAKEIETGSQADEIDGYSYKLEIIYDKSQFTSIRKNEFNPEDKFIRIKGEQVQLTEAFKNYQLSN